MLPDKKIKELAYYQNNQIPSNTTPVQVNIDTIKNRASTIFFEPFDDRPQDIFFFYLNHIKYIGRKHLSKLSMENKITGTKCSQLTPSMLLGVSDSEQMTDQGIIVSFYPLLPGEKIFLFDELKNHLQTEIVFPYPFLNQQHKEDISPDEFWDPTDEQVNSLNAGEIHIRNYTLAFLKKFDLSDKVIYDPACSTGAFLNSLKIAYPSVHTVGQDLNNKMANYARSHSQIDEIYDGNAKNSPVENESVDFIFFRFLNLEVLSTKTAHDIFAPIANRCKNGGYLILLGHTPILLNAAWFKQLGLTVEQSIAHDGHSIFQFYVLKKTQPVPVLNYEMLSILDRGAAPSLPISIFQRDLPPKSLNVSDNKSNTPAQKN